MKHGSTGGNDNVPYIIEKFGIISEASIRFCEFTNYNLDELLGRTVEDVFIVLLRVHTDMKYLNDETEAYIFTRFLEAKNVRIRKTKCNNSAQIKYVFNEIPDSGFIGKNPFLRN